ncbi:ATP-binding cassette domain-containing protein [Pararhizobium sp. YC-54]|uniref:ABC transporter ATP-binding protein n=1 Tax=Pararhizobium sp. YC-54 TaxID=2986920 RepID=UPI0021F6CA63|nr:ATP-binding cassette domain-containing protein [Pararhizobium sp. YC-54]MCW0001106.1 ATP-binding cassette domain-containing protein [Pararhizobium sp. YC-54]
MSSISLRQIKKSYAGLDILKSIDMEIEEGEFVVILGPSGCGKSTLLNVIAGLDDCDAGQIIIDGKDVIGLEPSQRGLAMVFQSYALFPAMTVRRNLSFGMEIAGTPKAKIAEKVAWVAKLLQIEALLERKPGQLSGGQRQRVAIGRALVRSSSICLFDEPLSNLDAKLRAETRVELKQLHETLKSTMIYVTHDQIEAMTMADRVAVMHKGRVEQFAHPQSIYEKPASLFVAGFVGSPAMNFLEGRLDGTGRFLSSDVAIDVSEYPFEQPATAGDAVFGVRCEDIAVVERGAAGSLPATLAFIELLGADALGWFDCLGKRFSVRLGIAAARAMGKDVGLHPAIAKASLFSLVSERRL